MNLIELNRALHQLRLGGMVAVRKRTPFPFWPWRASSVKIGSWRMS
jgi:hypothetical protein